VWWNLPWARTAVAAALAMKVPVMRTTTLSTMTRAVLLRSGKGRGADVVRLVWCGRLISLLVAVTDGQAIATTGGYSPVSCDSADLSAFVLRVIPDVPERRDARACARWRS
jgi:hypothetical protein